MKRFKGSVPVLVAAKVYGKDPAWVRAGIVTGYLPIGTATRNGKKVTSIEEMDSRLGRINYYISPELLFKHTGYEWKGENIMRSELSKNSENFIDRERFLELKHFCRQYDIWKKMYRLIDSGAVTNIDPGAVRSGDIPDPTAKAAMACLYYKERMGIIEKTVRDSSGDLYTYIFDGVTKGLSYEELEAKFGRVPCSRDTYYDRYRKFFVLLHARRK